MSWAHRKEDAEWSKFVADNAGAGVGGQMVFGRITYQLMASRHPRR
jgi:hypothetical protein